MAVSLTREMRRPTQSASRDYHTCAFFVVSRNSEYPREVEWRHIFRVRVARGSDVHYRRLPVYRIEIPPTLNGQRGEGGPG